MSADATTTPAVPPWRLNMGLFLVTAASVFATGVMNYSPGDPTAGKDQNWIAGVKSAFAAATSSTMINAGAFAVTILTILVAHEFGHYFAARLHKVDASLPFFLPMPILSPFGTMGAVIRMRGVIPTRPALLDIGAAGPLAGLVFALPLYAWGVSHSTAIPIPNGEMMEVGESVIVRLFDHFFAPTAPEGMTLVYSPVAFGAWGGLFVTMINLLPVGQLDGGHVAYALFGPKQDRYSRIAHRAMLVFFCVAILGHLGRDLTAGRTVTPALVGRHIGNSLFWLVWFQVLAILGTLASRANERPDAEDEDAPGVLTIRTRATAIVGLLFLAWMAKEQSSWFVVAGFFLGLGMLLAMEVKGGTLRPHKLLDHPATGEAPLGTGRKAIAIGTLILFALLFMPEPFSL